MNFKNNNGVTLTILTITIIILLTITSTIVYKSKNKSLIEDYDSLLIDIESLSAKIDEYYVKNGDLPTVCKYLNQEDLKSLLQQNAQNKDKSLGYTQIVNPNDAEDEYYVIDLEKLDGLTLNYGYDSDYKTVKSSGSVTSLTDINNVEDKIYIINSATHQIYYPYGVVLDDYMYFSAELGNSVSSEEFEANNFGYVDKFVVGEEETDTTFSTIWGTIDIIWLDLDNNVIDEPLNPANYLSYQGKFMSPVMYDSEETENDENGEFVKTTDTSKGIWYDYNGLEDQNKWANAITENGSYFVWIPRYAYRITYYDDYITNDDGTVTPDGEPTGYYDGYGQWNASTLELRLKLDDGIEVVKYNGLRYIVHPAFMKDDDKTGLEDYARGGWSEDIAGFWCAKYEASGTSTAIKFVPGVSSLRNMTIGEQYESAITATYGYDGLKANVDEVTSYMYSHQMKNSEWGAVAYLAHSKYGLNGKEIAINNSNSNNALDVTTGMSGGSATASSSDTTYKYNTENGVKASTTQNVYGIYDLSGGAMEYVAIYNKYCYYYDINGYGWDTIGKIPAIKGTVKDGETTVVSTKYATRYENNTSNYEGNNIIYTVGKVGDATKEVNQGGSDSITSVLGSFNWNMDYDYLVYDSVSFCERGRQL